ncbi:MAG: hypothetical protein ACREA0_24070, partial [bacterium]
TYQTVTQGSRLVRFAKGIEFGAQITFAEKTIAVATNEVRPETDSLKDWSLEGLAEGVAMGAIAMLVPEGKALAEGARRSVFKELVARYTGGRLAGIKHLVVDTALEVPEENLAEYLGRAFKGDLRAPTEGQIIDTSLIALSGGPLKVGTLAEHVKGNSVGAGPSVRPAAEKGTPEQQRAFEGASSQLEQSRLAAIRATLFSKMTNRDRLALTRKFEERLEDEDYEARSAAIDNLRNIISELEPRDRLAVAFKVEEKLNDANWSVRNQAEYSFRTIAPALEAPDRWALAVKIMERMIDYHEDSRMTNYSRTLGAVAAHLKASERLTLALKIEEHLKSQNLLARRNVLRFLNELFPLLEPENLRILAAKIEGRLSDEDANGRFKAIQALGLMTSYLESQELFSLMRKIEG